MWIPKPDTFHGNKDILQCYEALISGYLTAHDVQHHWLFSDSWGFYYQSVDQFGAYEPACVYPLWRNLNQLYGVRKKLLYQASLQELAAWMEESKEPVFLIVDQYDLPWVTEYGMIHHNHFMAISEWSQDRSQIRIQDLWPIEYREWHTLDDFDAAYRARGSHAFQLSAPSMRCDHDMLPSQLKRWIAAAEGEVLPEYRSGLHGLRQFGDQLANLGETAPMYAEMWFDRLRRVVDVRLLFVEFLSMLQCSEWKEAVGDRIVSTIELCIAAWHSLRNYFIISRLKSSYQAVRSLELLEKVIEREQASLQEVRALLVRIEQSIERQVIVCP